MVGNASGRQSDGSGSGIRELRMRLIVSLAALAVFGWTSTSHAADLGGYYPRGGGSIKDSGPAYAPEYRPASNPCYMRADVGYGWSGKATLRRSSYDDNDNYLGDDVTGSKSSGAWLTDLGLGCGQGSHGFRGELVLGLRGSQSITGMTLDGVGMEADVRSYTGMMNAYYDMGSFGGFVPYVGAGIGAAYNKMGNVTQTGGGYVDGGEHVSLAWSLLAGVGYKISDRLTLDLGYRYIDLGSVSSSEVKHCPCGDASLTNRLKADDLTAHELKLGMRFYPNL
jgi:opacity protein-like surface antigen